jgi:Mn-dependent DtxR family transcriptional regulator
MGMSDEQFKKVVAEMDKRGLIVEDEDGYISLTIEGLELAEQRAKEKEKEKKGDG